MYRKLNRLEHFTRLYKGKLYKFFRNGEEFYKTVEAYAKYPKQTKFEHFSGLFGWFVLLPLYWAYQIYTGYIDIWKFLIIMLICFCLGILIGVIEDYKK